MARKPMVTRTMKFTEATVLCADIQSEETFEVMVTLPGRYSTDRALLEACHEVNDTDEVKTIYVKSAAVKTARYGMTESEFLKSAHPMAPEKGDAGVEKVNE